MEETMTTFVLLHGAYQGGWIWQPVAQRLREAGHLVYAPTLDGCGERRHAVRPGITNATHGAEIAKLLFYEDLKDVVLVGTSCGGMVMTQAAELARERIGRLVFADALALMDGESLSDIVKRPAAVTTELTTGVSPEDVSGRLFKDLDPATREWAAARVTQHPIAAMRDPMVLKSFWQQPWKATVIWCRQSANPPVAHQKRAADALSASWHEIDTGHYPMLSTPDELSRLIMG
jgi:pimeloyl-ACP methyl ester carboxylesterase